LDLRDTALENTASELGEFASRVADEINRIHNNNVAFPAPNSLTGSRNSGLLTTDPHNFTGRVTFSVIDPNAPTVDGYGVINSVVVDFDANTVTRDFGAPVGVPLTSIADVIAAVNGANGLNGSATLALTNGVMSLTAANANHGVGLIQDATTPSDRAGRGFSHFFGLNDLVTSGSQTFFEHGFVGTDTHQFTGTTDFTIRDANGQIVTTVNFTAVAAHPGHTAQHGADGFRHQLRNLRA
jgi:flagellar hook-associated protein 1 FlgK